MADEILHFLRISTFPHHSKAPSTAMDYCTADDPFVQYEHLAKSWEHSGQSHRWKKQLKAPQSKKTAEGGVRKVSYSSENQCPEAAEGIAQHRGITCLKWQGTSFKSNAFAASHVRAVSDRIKRVVSKRQAPHLHLLRVEMRDKGSWVAVFILLKARHWHLQSAAFSGLAVALSFYERCI